MRPLEPFAHVAGEDRYNARMAALSFVRVQRGEPLLEIDLLPLPGQQFAEPNAGEVSRYEKRPEVIGQRIAQLAILLVRQESLPRVSDFAHEWEVRQPVNFRRCAFAPKIERR